MSSATHPLPAGTALATRRAGARRASHDGLTPTQFRSVVLGIVAVHVFGAWGLMQVPAVRDAVIEAAPIFVNFISPPAPPVPPPPVPPPPPKMPVLKKPPPPNTLVTAAPTPAPAPFVAEPPPPIPEPAPAPMPTVAEAPPAPPAPAPPPKTIPASAVQFLEALPVEYPRTSKRLSESGRVMVRVYIDEAGRPLEVQLQRSSGFSRLDEEAVRAVRKARFKPPTENGRPIAGWATVPVIFELEK
jgi:protein TonB